MSIIVKPNTFTVGATIIASEHNSNFDTIYNDYNGNISNNNIAPSAGIVDTKLAQITTANKVSIEAVSTMSGIIVMWSGAISAIPTGWVICDGNNGTPDLTDRFVIHADSDSGGTNDVGDTGGAHSATISQANLPNINFVVPASPNGAGGAGTSPQVWTAQSVTSSFDVPSGGSGTAVSTIPKYYALAYIMKT